MKRGKKEEWEKEQEILKMDNGRIGENAKEDRKGA